MAVGLPRPAPLRLRGLGGGPAPPAVPRPSPAAGRLRAVGVWSGSRSASAVLLLLAGAVGGLLGGFGVAVLAVAGAAAATSVRGRRRRTEADRSERSRADEACVVLASELRAGRSPADALAFAAQVAAGPMRRALSAAAGSARLGGDVPAALVAPPSAVPEVLRGLAACWLVCSGAGSGLAAAVERLGEGLRSEADRRRAVAAELAGPRATAALLALLPLAGLLLAAGLGASPLHVLLHTPLGLVCLLVGVTLDGLGLLWTQRLVARAARAA